MNYYEIAPADRSFKGSFLPIYSSRLDLEIGQIILVKLKTHLVNGFIVSKINQPNFTVKNIEKVCIGYCLKPINVEFFCWLNQYYPGSLGATASLFIPSNIVESPKNTKNPILIDVNPTSKFPKLSNQQKITVESINKSPNKLHIIHGDTGTGKTRIYLELCKQIIESGRSVLILTPEIGLTPQMYEQFIGVSKNIIVIHSQIPLSKKRNIWLKLTNNDTPHIIIGPRSSLFMPLQNIGLIIIDEFHDSAYKQDQSPKFQTVRIASKLAQLNGANIILGSATPPIEDYFYASKKDAQIHRITEIPNIDKPDRTIKIIDLSDKNERTNYDMISKSLIVEIAKNLDKSEQSMIFINKRGSSRTITCEDCGFIFICNRCNIPYIYHRTKNQLVCHTCNNRMSAPKTCKECKSPKLLFKNPGTQQIEQSLKKIFPNAKIKRYDNDNKKNESLTNDRLKIISGDIDIIVGTQIISKGHDLPKLSLVGILDASSGLQFPDYTAGEKNFQIINQLIGRVGRGHVPGRVIVQAFGNLDNIKKITEQSNESWFSFYKNELVSRRKYDYPPFTFILKLEMSMKNEQKLINKIEKLSQDLSAKIPELKISSPSPAMQEMKNGKHYWQLIIRSKDRKKLQQTISILPNNCSYDLDPINLI